MELKNSWKYLKNKRGSGFIFFSILTIIGIVLAVSISIRQAVLQTVDRLWEGVPHLVALEPDFEEMRARGSSERGSVTPEIVEEIGQLSQVRSFSYALPVQVWGEGIEFYRPPNSLILDSYDAWFSSLSTERWFHAQGVAGNVIAEIESGLIRLKEGRSLQEGDWNGVLISVNMAEVNQLQLGSVIRLTTPTIPESPYGDPFSTASPKEVFEVEVVGIFALDRQFDSGHGIFDNHRHEQLLNQLYISLPLAIGLMDQKYEYFNRFPEFYQQFADWEGMDWERGWYRNSLPQQTSFLLYDIRELDEFRVAAGEVLPYSWRIRDFSEVAFPQMKEAALQMELFSQQLLIGSLFALSMVTVLLVSLYLKEVRQEMAIYLALGQSKRRLFLILIKNVAVVMVLSLSAALVVGHLIAGVISQELLQQNLLAAEVNPFVEFGSFSQLCMGCEGYPFRFHNPADFTVDEMLAAFGLSLSAGTVFSIYFWGLFTAFLSTTLSSIYLWRLSPRESLLKSQG